MKRDQADKYCGKLVAVTFLRDWFNEATQSWIYEECEYVGVLDHCPYKGQEEYYCLYGISEDPLPTDRACWKAWRMKSIREL